METNNPSRTKQLNILRNVLCVCVCVDLCMEWKRGLVLFIISFGRLDDENGIGKATVQPI